MKYNLQSTTERNNAFQYLTDLSATECLVEVKKINPKRSLKQNSYIHLTFGIFGMETGYTSTEAKTIFKRIANPEIFIYEKKGQKFLRSSADLDTKEMTQAIDKWRKYAGENGVEIPPPENEESIRHWQNIIEQNGGLL